MRVNTFGKVLIGTAVASAAHSALSGRNKKSSGGDGCFGCAAVFLLMGLGGMWLVFHYIMSLFS